MSDNIHAGPIDAAAITDCLNQFCDVSVYGEIASTNEQALDMFRQGKQVPFACFAESQSQGRGRRGNAWLSPASSNIYMSLAWCFECPVNQLAQLSLVMAVAVARCLETIGLAEVAVKWPNDVLVGGEKIAGILIETASISHQRSEVVIGIGLNYAMPESVKKRLSQPVTDICSQLGTVPLRGRNGVAGLLLDECMVVCQSYFHDVDKLMHEYRDCYDVCAGKQVRILLEDGGQLEGRSLGIAATGELRVEINGEERMFNSAEVSLRT